jgi:predicted metal-binding membrane protein
MLDATLERALRHDRAIVLVSLALITVLAWLYVIRLAAAMDMASMDMTGMRMTSAGLRMVMAPAMQPWTIADFILMFAMWAVMMAGMMTPSVTPLVLLYARVARQAEREARPLAATAWFAGGYLAAWTAFSLVATTAQWGLERGALLTPMMATANRWLAALVLIVSGAYQWSRAKQACLTHCQSPLQFLQRHGGFRRHATGALWLGFRHGLYCVGCCWSLMALLFVGGVMNLVWIAAISAFVLLEKALPGRALVSRVMGIGLVAAGARLIVMR